MSLRLLLALSGSLEILAGLLAPIQSGTGGIVSVRSTSGLDRSSPDAALRRRGVRAGATCMKACDDVQSPSGLAVSIWVTICKVPAAAVIIWTATGSAPGGLLLWKTGIVHSGFGVLFLAVLAGTKR